MASLWERIENSEFKSKLHPSTEPTARDAYRADCARLREEFKAAVLADTGLTAHPKADRAFDLAWAMGHSDGLCEVLSVLGELAELLKD